MFRVIVSFALVTFATGAAQARPHPPDLAEICAADIERFCPALSGTSATRNQRICLRPYRNSLARACRRALADRR